MKRLIIGAPPPTNEKKMSTFKEVFFQTCLFLKDIKTPRLQCHKGHFWDWNKLIECNYRSLRGDLKPFWKNLAEVPRSIKITVCSNF